MKKSEEKCNRDICPIQKSLDTLWGKWKFINIWNLKKDTLRNSELKKSIPLITDKMLAQELKSLEKDNIVKRKAYPSVPPKVEYSLTKKGKDLLPILKDLWKWSKTY